MRTSWKNTRQPKDGGRGRTKQYVASVLANSQPDQELSTRLSASPWQPSPPVSHNCSDVWCSGLSCLTHLSSGPVFQGFLHSPDTPHWMQQKDWLQLSSGRRVCQKQAEFVITTHDLHSAHQINSTLHICINMWASFIKWVTNQYRSICVEIKYARVHWRFMKHWAITAHQWLGVDIFSQLKAILI